MNYHFWTVIEKRRSKSLCRCICGKEKLVANYSLTSGKSKSCGCKSKELAKSTFKKKYGHENPSAAQEIKEKKRQTLRKNFGVDSPWESEEIRRRMEKTMLKRYGVHHNSQMPDHKSKCKATCTEKYGVENHSLLSGSKKKSQETNQKFYIDDTPLKVWCELKEVPYRTVLPKMSYMTPEEVKSFVEEYTENCRTSIEILLKKLSGPEFDENKRVTLDSGKWYVPDLLHKKRHLAFNADGLFWHRTGYKAADYHFRLREDLAGKGIEIFQFYQDEIIEKPEIVSSIIKHKLGENRKVFARKCEVRKINEITARSFLEQNHLMGFYKGARHFGLFYQDRCVAVMSVTVKNRYVEIARFACKAGYSVTGGFSKLLKTAKSFKKDIVSFVDLRYGNGGSLVNLGFRHVSTHIGWCWSDGRKRYHRLQCTAGDEMSEKEAAALKKWFKIHDAGQAKFILDARE